MAEERTSIVSSEDSSLTRQRKKRKWDQPADSLVTAGIIPLTNPLSAAIRMPLTQQHANAIAQKLSLPKIQDELLIAREIVINDADSSVRYKLTKRQTQEEIQRCTGAVVITRGKYHPPNAPSDGDKPLYLHVSAGAHFKDTAERILAVDRAASMVDEMLKQVQALGSTLPPLINGTKGSHAFSTCVFLGFDPDPSLNISARVRGPSDQYINHIMNETGVNVICRGHGSGNIENPNVGEGQEQLHLFLSSSDSTSLDNAKRLAENLLDTISVECGVPRVSSFKVISSVPAPQQVYSAVPPPSHLVVGPHNYGSNIEASTGSATALMTSSSRPPIFSQGIVSGQARPLLSGGTNYSGYEGIYPQATALQQVAHALRQSASPVSSVSALPSSAPITEPALSVGSNSEMEKRPPQRRKFQESPITSKGSAKPIQVFSLTFYQANLPTVDLSIGLLVCMFHRVLILEGSEFKRPSQPSAHLSTRNVLNTMPPPLPRAMVPPPPPPKFTSRSPTEKGQEKNYAISKVKPDVVPDTLVKLMEYGNDDDEEHVANVDEANGSNSGATQKPFWAL